MSYPYLTDILNAIFGTDWGIPAPTFGAFVALALLVSTSLARTSIRRLEAVGVLPASTQSIALNPPPELTNLLV